MKVKELIVMLEKLDENLELVCLTKDEEFLQKNQTYRTLEISSVDLAKVKLLTPQKALPTVKLRQTSVATSEKQVVIEMRANASPNAHHSYERRTGIDRRVASRESNFSFGQRAN
jgi:hypothetical protein